jgi:hypothetical protein
MRRAPFLLLAVALAVALAAAAVARAVAVSDTSVTVGRNRAVNPARPLDADNSPTVATNPLAPRSVVITHRVDRPEFSAFVEWSDDGGASWHQTPLPLPAGLGPSFAPDAAFAPDGTLYVSYVNLEGPGNVPDNLWVARSSDGGRSLSEPVRVAGKLAFQARLAAAPDGTVLVTWLQAEFVGLFKMPGSPNPVVASRSTDGGRTFSAPVQVSDAERQRVGAASPVVDADGRLVVLYEDFKGDRRDFEYLEGPPAEEPFALVVTTSSDGGGSFSPGVELESGVVPTRRFLVFLPEFPSLAAGPRGSLLVAWADGRNGDEDVFLRRSDDGGRTWSAPTRVNDNRLGDGTAQYLPRVAAAPSGRIDVLFLDRRRDRRNVMTDAFLASSGDGGRSFRNRRVSSKSFDSRVGPFIDAPLPIDFGSRLGLASGDRVTVAAWTDSRLGSDATGRQDIFAARLAPRSASALDWAGVVALALLATGAAGLAVRRGRGAPAGPGDGGDGMAPSAGLPDRSAPG